MRIRAKIFLLTVFAQAPWLVLLGLLALSTRYWLQDDADGFQRLGSIYVACGVFLAATRRTAFDWFHRLLDAAFGPTPDPSSNIDALEHSLDIDEARVASKESFFYGEAFMVISGTVMWGYGDLIVAAFRA